MTYSTISSSTISPVFSSDEEAGAVVGEITVEGGLVICSVCVGTTAVEGTTTGLFRFKKNKMPKVTATTPTPAQTAIKTLLDISKLEALFDIKKSIS